MGAQNSSPNPYPWRIEMKVSLSIGRALFLATLALSSIPAVQAQARPAITQDRDQEGRNFYTQTSSCNTVTFGYCQITFPTVPAGQRLIITHISALALMPAANTITSSDLRTLNGSIQGFYAPSSFVNLGSGTYNYTYNETTLAKFDTGEAPQFIVFVNSGANFQLVAVISGYTVSVP